MTKWQRVEVEQGVMGNETIKVKLSSRAVMKEQGLGDVSSQEKMHTNRNLARVMAKSRARCRQLKWTCWLGQERIQGFIEVSSVSSHEG